MACFAPEAIEKGDVLTPTGMVKTLNSRFLGSVANVVEHDEAAGHERG
jgi:hypothetical protein